MSAKKRFVTVMIVALVSFVVATACCPTTLFSQPEEMKQLGEEIKKGVDTIKSMIEPPAPTPLASGERDLVKNGSFKEGLSSWQTRTQGGSKVEGTNTVELRNVGEMSVLEVKRTNGDNDGGGAYASQDINTNVSIYYSLIVRVTVNPVMERGGNIGGTRPEWFPEGACQIRVYYTDVSGQDAQWYHGFYYTTVAGVDANTWSQVPQAQWYRYASTDLMQLPQKPKTIKKVEVYGFGWEFVGYLTNVQIIVK